MPRFPDSAHSRIVLVGTSDYEQSNELPNLPAVRANLSGLEAVLTDPDGGVFTFDSCTIVDSPDSPGSLMRRLSRAAGEAEDVLLVYYAGHGVLGWNGDLHLCVRETDQNQVSGTAVPFDWIRQTIQNSTARVRILILDCCFSGRAVGAMSSNSAALEQINVAGTYVLTSTEANKISHAIPGERYTAFTGELIRLLDGRDSPPNSEFTLEALYPRLSAAMSRRGLPRPKAVLGDTAGSLALRKPLIRQDQVALQPTPTPETLPLVNVTEVRPPFAPWTTQTAATGPTPAHTAQLDSAHLSNQTPQPVMSALGYVIATGKARAAWQLAALVATWTVFVCLVIFFLTGFVTTLMGDSNNNVIGAAIGLPLLAACTVGCALLLRKIHRSRRATRRKSEDLDGRK